jgi:hypothetical protein
MPRWGVPSMSPSSGSLRSPTVNSGQLLGQLSCHLGRWRAGRQCFPKLAADENGAMAKLTDSLFAKLLEEDADDECRS